MPHMLTYLPESSACGSLARTRDGPAPAPQSLVMVSIMTSNYEIKGNFGQLLFSLISQVRCKTENRPHLTNEHVCVIPRGIAIRTRSRSGRR